MSTQEDVWKCNVLAACELLETIPPQRFNVFGNKNLVLMFPRSHNGPSVLAEDYAVSSIARSCRLKLVTPPFGIRPGSDRMVRATVPKAAVHKDRNLRLGENDVRAPLKRFQVHDIAETSTVKFTSQSQFRPRAFRSEG